MQRLGVRDYQQQIQYHLDDGRAPEFDKGQPGRVDLARFLIDKILKKDLTRRPLKFVELGCGAGDITGPYSGEIEVHGYDVTPMAQETCNRRWPEMNFHLQPVEEVEPYECDLLVLCEFLEHVDDPIKIVSDWLPLAKWAVIGHPLNEPDPPFEPGHIWSYTLDDWHHWFELGGHHIWERFLFPMGYWDNMVMGHSCRTDQPPFAGPN
jgi:trans-aconitate methyltransferase